MYAKEMNSLPEVQDNPGNLQVTTSVITSLGEVQNKHGYIKGDAQSTLGSGKNENWTLLFMFRIFQVITIS